MKKRNVIYIVGGMLLLAALTVASAIAYDNSKKVPFLDEEMGYVIAYQAYQDGEIKEPEGFRQNDLEKIKELNIGYTGYYTTLLDLKKCPNLEYLYINATDAASHRYYNRMREMPEPENGERIEQFQKELADILRTCEKIHFVYIWNPDGVCNLESLEFLKEAENLRVLWLDELAGMDYTPVWQCEGLTSLEISACDIADVDGISQLRNLTILSLRDTNISEAGDLLNLPNLERLEIENTPLAENEEELALLYEAFPNIEIWK